MTCCHCSSANLEYATKRAREAETELATLKEELAQLRAERVSYEHAMRLVNGLVTLYARSFYPDAFPRSSTMLNNDWRKWTADQYQTWVESQPHEVRQAIEFIDRIERGPAI